MKKKIISIMLIVLFLSMIGINCYAAGTYTHDGYYNAYTITLPSEFTKNYEVYYVREQYKADHSSFKWNDKGIELDIYTFKKENSKPLITNTTVLNGCTVSDLNDAYRYDKDILKFFDNTHINPYSGDYGASIFYADMWVQDDLCPLQNLSWEYSTRSGNVRNYTVLDEYAIESNNYIAYILFKWSGSVAVSDGYVNYQDIEPQSWFKDNDEFWGSTTQNSIINSFRFVDNANNKVANLDFEDVISANWYSDAVRYNYKNGIISGYNEYTFAPQNNLTREQLVALLYRIEGQPSVSGLSNNFSDVPNGQWYTNAIKWANAHDIVKGYGGTDKFGLGDNILRQDLAIMLKKYAEYKGKYTSPTSNLNGFADKNTVSNYAVEAVTWASGKGIISGNNNSDGTKTIAPLNNATRAEAAVMMMRFCENVLK